MCRIIERDQTSQMCTLICPQMPLTPLKYSVVKNYRHVYLYIYGFAEYADSPSSGQKINRSSNFIGLYLLCL